MQTRKHLSRMDKDEQLKGIETIRPNPVIDKVIQNLRILHPDVPFELNHWSSEEIQLRINSQHFEQILLIILDNGIKYSSISTILSYQTMKWLGSII